MPMAPGGKEQSGRPDELAAAIAEEGARLVALERERKEVELRLRGLRNQLSAYESSAVTAHEADLSIRTSSSITPGDKVRLFRSLFRGRDDVYPQLWENSRTGKKGYAPACANEWVRGVCEKPRVKCGECPHQAFLPLTDQVILDHLQGRHVVGVYPLLKDEMCWLLAVDFDKREWVDDTAAFVETCRNISIPAAVERSRSGNGAHVWFFFAAPIAASTARMVIMINQC